MGDEDDGIDLGGGVESGDQKSLAQDKDDNSGDDQRNAGDWDCQWDEYGYQQGDVNGWYDDWGHPMYAMASMYANSKAYRARASE